MRIVFWISWLTFLLVIIRMQYQISKIMKQMAVERTEAIAELKHTADELVEKTTSIAETVKKDAMDTATELAKVTAGQLDVKIEKILTRFDEAAGHQQKIKDVVDDTNVVLHKELESNGSTNLTTRDQIDTIKDATTPAKKGKRR